MCALGAVYGLGLVMTMAGSSDDVSWRRDYEIVRKTNQVHINRNTHVRNII